MLGEVLVSIGALLFAILLCVIYFTKSKNSSVENVFFKVALILICFIIISELSAVFSLYYLGDESILSNILVRLNGFLTIAWIIVVGCYVVTLGNAFNKSNLAIYIKEDKQIKKLIILYCIIIFIFPFLSYKNVITFKYAYMSGPALYYIYLVAAITVLLSIWAVRRNKYNLDKSKRIPLIIGIVETILSIIFQLMFPNVLVITGSLVFKMYLDDR